MSRDIPVFGNRLVSALLTALGVMVVVAGLLSYTDPTVAGSAVEASPAVVVPSPSPSTSSVPVATPSPSAAPNGSASPGASAATAHATRVLVPALAIDLPVVAGTSDYPLCNVAMYIDQLAQPGQGRATYLYAHARTGMFGPIYALAHAGQQQQMVGMIVEVYTSDDQLYLYVVSEVRLHQQTLNDAFAATTEQLWLQTSEGPKGTPGKTQVIALPLSVGRADAADAHPSASPVVCG
jgi:sortase (surface protein transpeptidase)